jgi:hypothetical protein
VLGQARGHSGDERPAADERLGREEPSGKPSFRGRGVYVDEIHVEAGLADCISGGSRESGVADDSDLANAGFDQSLQLEGDERLVGYWRELTPKGRE